MKASLSNEFSGFVGCKKERSCLSLRHCHSLILRQPARRTIFLFNDCENSIMLQGGNRVQPLGLRVVDTSSGIYYFRLPPIISNFDIDLIYFLNYLLLDDLKDRYEVTTYIGIHYFIPYLCFFSFYLCVCNIILSER